MRNLSLTVAAITLFMVAAIIDFSELQKEPDNLSSEARQDSQLEVNHPIAMGWVTTHPQKGLRRAKPIINYIAQQLTGDESAQGNVYVFRTTAEMVDAMNKGEIDLFVDSPFPVAIAVIKSEVVPFLLRWKKGVKNYHSVIVARRSSGIKELDDLRGQTIAFESSFSTTGCWLPKIALQNAKIRLRHVTTPGAPISNDEVGYVFSEDDENSLYWIKSGQVAAGAMDNETFESLEEIHREQLTVIATTPTVPRHIVCHAKDMAPKLVNQIATILQGMTETNHGRMLLNEFSNTKKFSGIDSESMSQFNSLVRVVMSELGH